MSEGVLDLVTGCGGHPSLQDHAGFGFCQLLLMLSGKQRGFLHVVEHLQILQHGRQLTQAVDTPLQAVIELVHFFLSGTDGLLGRTRDILEIAFDKAQGHQPSVHRLLVSLVEHDGGIKSGLIPIDLLHTRVQISQRSLHGGETDGGGENTQLRHAVSVVSTSRGRS